MEAPARLLRRSQRRQKQTRIGIAVAVAVVVLLVIVVPCAVLLPSGPAGPKQPSEVLLPLYIYPSSGAWEPLFNAVTLNSDVNFTVIVNPESGPGSGESPGDDYVSAIQRLNAIPNVRTVGYVRTGYGDRDIDTVTREVATYSGWSQLNNSLSVMGIFFDEAPHEWTLERQRYLAAANQAVVDAAGIRQPKLIIHNPGTPPDPRLDDTRTDIIVAFESPFDSFQDRQADLKSLSGDRSSYSFMVLDVPEGENMRKLVQRMSRQARYLFVTTASRGYYEHFSDSWAEFANIMAS